MTQVTYNLLIDVTRARNGVMLNMRHMRHSAIEKLFGLVLSALSRKSLAAIVIKVMPRADPEMHHAVEFAIGRHLCTIEGGITASGSLKAFGDQIQRVGPCGGCHVK